MSRTAQEVALDAAALTGADATYPLFSLHALQMRPHAGGEWQDCPARLFLQERDEARIIALCGTTSRQFTTSTYDGFSFKLGERGFVDRFQLLTFFRLQRQLILQLLDQTGAVRLSLGGDVEPVALELGTNLSLDQMQEAVGGFISIHSWDGEQQAHKLDGTCLVLDEDGKDARKPINALATCLWYQVYPLGTYSTAGQGAPDYIVGDVLLARDSVLRGDD